jgi:hypothetical protein
LFNKILPLASALGVTKFIIVAGMILVSLCFLLKSDLDVQQTHLWAGRTEGDLWNKSLRLATALGVTKFPFANDMIWGTFCSAT